MQQAARLIEQFTTDRSFDDYLTDAMLRAAVERQFEIIGEALTKLARLDGALAARISEHRRVIAFRNLLIHSYAEVDNELVWEVVETKLSPLQREIDGLLREP
jgi:uncharacterized protein with HEPN domain